MRFALSLFLELITYPERARDGVIRKHSPARRVDWIRARRYDQWCGEVEKPLSAYQIFTIFSGTLCPLILGLIYPNIGFLRTLPRNWIHQ